MTPGDETDRRSHSRFDWIELVTGFTCNCRCRVCPSPGLQESEGLSGADMFAWLERGREAGATGVWFGGGEPSLHPDLVPAVERALRLGYRRIRIQTNGLRFAYPAFSRRLVAAGANEFALSIKGADAETHNSIARNPQAFELMQRAARELVALGARVEGDILITTRSMPGLADAVERFAETGLIAFTFWLVSLHGLDQERDAGWLPCLADLKPHLQRAFDRADTLGVEATSLHTPPCALDPPYRSRYKHSGTWRLLVVTPGNEPFMAEESPIEGGVYFESCRECSRRLDCLGLRADYLDLHGDTSLDPLP